MTQYSTEPEYSVVEKQEGINQQWVPSKTSSPDYMAVVADLDLLYQELNISVDILGKIRDSLRVLELSLEAHQ